MKDFGLKFLKTKMNKVINQNDVFRKFDFHSVITKSDDASACNLIKDIIADGNYFTNSPKFQTKENIFSRSEPIWLKYRMSFLFSVFMYLGREVKVSNMMAWSYMTNLETHEDRNKLWHNHWHPQNPDAKMMSGIWYLHIPEDVKDRDYCGTEMAPNGPEQEGKFFVTPTDGHWLIYPSDQWHRPGIPQSNQYRFILACDIEYRI
jgi:hypothetical protein